MKFGQQIVAFVKTELIPSAFLVFDSVQLNVVKDTPIQKVGVVDFHDSIGDDCLRDFKRLQETSRKNKK